jgi:HSP20 family protein
MSLIKWEPFGEFDNLVGSSGLFPSVSKTGFDLAVDLYEEKGVVVAQMSLPGMKPEDITVEIEGDLLSISGSREEEEETHVKEYYSKEIRRGSFSRSVRLPKLVDSDKAGAQYTNGVLKISMPVLAGQKDKGVKVRVKS